VGSSLYCKFGFPKVPMLKTIIIRPLPVDLPDENRRKHERTFEKIRKTVKRLDDLQQKGSGSESVVKEQEYPSSDAFLRTMELSWLDNVLGLRSSVQKTTIFYKRDQMLSGATHTMRRFWPCRIQIWTRSLYWIPTRRLLTSVRT
jgi:hypothetical protein